MSNLDYNTGNILSKFPIFLRKNIEQLCLKSKIGLLDICLSDISLIHNNIVDEDSTKYDNFHFIIKVPYAGKRLKWELLFDPEDLEFAPDFHFNDNHFLDNPDHDTIDEYIPSLVNWNIRNPKILSQVLNEFLLLYKKLQIEKLKDENIYSHYCEEYEALISPGSNIGIENIEVQVEPSSIQFLISIKIDCTALPKYAQPLNSDHYSWFNPGEDFVHLKFSVYKLDGSRSNVSIYFSPRIDQVLGGSKGLHIPEYKRDIPLSQYVASVSTAIKNRFDFIVEHYKMKKIFISTLVAICNHSIVEYDTENFTKVVFLHTAKDYICLVSIIIGQKFPQDKPTVTLSSIYCQEGRNCIENLDRYPYSMDDTPEENITLLLKTLDDAVFKFKHHGHH